MVLEPPAAESPADHPPAVSAMPPHYFALPASSDYFLAKTDHLSDTHSWGNIHFDLKKQKDNWDTYP